MRYEDLLYGEVSVSEPVLEDLITSDAMHRIKGVAQHGITALLGITPTFSRFDHSVGAMLLVRRMGASVDEQIAALLHDISHTAFSHVIDFVFSDHNGQSYHEQKKVEFVGRSDIPVILKRHKRDWRDFMDEEQFSLLEQPSPALCADRLDYFFRDLEGLKLANRDEVQLALRSLVVEDCRIVVSDLDTARWLAYTFIEADRASWSNFREVGLYQLTAEAIKAAWHHGEIDETDIWGTDETLWNTLLSSKTPEVARWVRLVAPGTRFTWNEQNPLFCVSSKVRSIDPPVRTGNTTTALSEQDSTFAKYRKEYLASKSGSWPMEVVAPPHIAT